MRKLLVSMVVAGSILSVTRAWARDDDPFALRSVASPGRTAAAELVDLDGDGRTDLVAAVFDGIPPNDTRELRAWFQRDDGSLPETPDLSFPLPVGAAAYDVLELDGAPGLELVLLRSDRLTIASFPDREPQLRERLLPGPTIAAVRDERGLDRLLMLRPELPGRLLVPGLGELFVLDLAGGEPMRLSVGARSNYFLPPRPGPGIGENEIETFYDFPRIDVGDVDGDGRPDLVASNRFEIRVFLQDPDAAFPARPDRALDVGRVSEEDLIRGSGLVRLRVEDFDGDGRMDVVLTYTAGGLLEARSRTTLHRNREGSWDLESPDQELRCDGCFVSYDLMDLQGDGKLELLEARVPLGILQLVETLLTRSIDVDVRIYERGAELPFSPEAWVSVGLDLGFRFETYEPRGFFPTLRADWNGDGFFDRLSSGNGEALEIYLGGSPSSLRQRAARQSFDSSGALRIGDLDGDELPDLLVFDRTRPDTPIRIGVNRGILPGTPKRPRLTAP
jgi:hypothetical protein